LINIRHNEDCRVSSADNLREAQAKEVSARLSEGLQACRAVVQDYRKALQGSVRDASWQSNDNKPLDGEFADDHRAEG
jgi:hypothetical protein